MPDGNPTPLTTTELAPRRSAWQRWRRPLLLGAVPALVTAGALYVYVTGGRFVDTDNAYLKAHMVQVSTDISGRVTEVLAHENEAVHAGDPLLRLDTEPLDINLAQAKADLDAVGNEIAALKASYRQRQQDLEAANSTLGMAQREYNRRQKLIAGKVISESEFDAARNERDVAQRQVASISEDMHRILAELGGDPDVRPEDHPRIRAAQAKVDAAERDLRHAVILAPDNGIISQIDNLRPGDYATAGRPVFSLVSEKEMWVEANFKETDLTFVRPGQKAEISVDTYPGTTFAATVESIGAATGAEFSALPAQNATGNWVKVVQRIPVRLHILPTAEGADKPLRAGMSAVVDIDTEHHRLLPGFIKSAAAWVGVE
ncbi:HlyD family secretion protein [Dongia sp.]|uniref:HlyD family secretion protein n=1 Tax=Dongia sp. TaxID=1977262 RepID=UPI0035B390D3